MNAQDQAAIARFVSDQLDFVLAGIERFGSPEAFFAAHAAWKAEQAVSA